MTEPNLPMQVRKLGAQRLMPRCLGICRRTEAALGTNTKVKLQFQRTLFQEQAWSHYSRTALSYSAEEARAWAVRELTLGHMDSKWQTEDSHLGQCGSKADA